MTQAEVTEIINRPNIMPDRYGLAAISMIFKAFGDTVRAKETWPWSSKTRCPWTPSDGAIIDIDYAIQFLTRAKEIYEQETPAEPEEYIPEDNQIKALNNRIKDLSLNITNVKEKSEDIIETSEDVTDKINRIMGDQTKLFWYVGTTPITPDIDPTQLPEEEIHDMRDKETPGWHKIDGRPEIINVGYITDTNNFTKWYIAVPERLGINKVTTNWYEDYSLSSEIITLGDVRYRVFTTLNDTDTILYTLTKRIE